MSEDRLDELRARARQRTRGKDARPDTPEEAAEQARNMEWAMPLQLEAMAGMDEHREA